MEVLRDRPRSVVPNDGPESDSVMYLVPEKKGFELKTPLAIDARTPDTLNGSGQLIDDSLAAGTTVDSYLLHFDKAGSGTRDVRRQGTLTFSAPDRLQLTFGRARRPGSATLLTVLGLGFTGGAVFTIGAGGVIGGLFLLLLAVLTSWGAYFYWTYRSEVDVGSQGIEVRAGATGFKKTTRIPCESFTEVRLLPQARYTMLLSHSGDGVVTKGGERMKPILKGIGVYGPLQRMGPTESEGVVAARMLTDHQEAEWLASQIEETAARVR